MAIMPGCTVNNSPMSMALPVPGYRTKRQPSKRYNFIFRIRSRQRELLANIMTKYVVVTGGVVSSLGKGIAAASLAAILESRGLRVTMLKLDPYINVDPGTMSPFQHGEVFVTEDGAETDLDLGHYERFISTRRSEEHTSELQSRGHLVCRL